MTDKPINPLNKLEEQMKVAFETKQNPTGDRDKKVYTIKSEEEYTSPVSKIYKVENEYIIITENSIYVVSSDIPTKRISGA